MNFAGFAKNSALNEAAARWFIRMQEAEPDSPQRTQFEAWLMQSEQHQAEYASICEAWDGISSLDELKKLAVAREAKYFIKQTNQAKKIKKAVSAVSLCVILAFAGLFGNHQYQQWQASPTMQMARQSGTAEILTQTLDDGTQVTLNASSKIEVTYYRNQRHIALLQGEAIFNVTKDPDRPFIVETDTAKITVLGTRFAINKLSKLVRVSVDHGSVRVESKDPASSIILNNGEVAEIRNGKATQHKDADAADYFRFATGTVVFNQADIYEIADVLSRYRKENMTAQGASQEKINAVLEIKDMQTFLGILPRIANVNVLQASDGTVIQAGTSSN
jgi:transmembrane sensor